MILLPELITHKNAQQVRDEGLKTLSLEPEAVIDGSSLKEFDSSILAVLLAWKRVRSGLIIEKVPAKLQMLARVYGLTELFLFKKI